jgi:hypothetical protein
VVYLDLDLEKEEKAFRMTKRLGPRAPFNIVCNGVVYSISKGLLIDKLFLFSEHLALLDAESYAVRSSVRSDVFTTFVRAMQDDNVEINSRNFTGLQLLADEFQFEELQHKLREFRDTFRDNIEPDEGVPADWGFLITCLESDRLAAQERKNKTLRAAWAKVSKLEDELAVVREEVRILRTTTLEAIEKQQAETARREALEQQIQARIKGAETTEIEEKVEEHNGEWKKELEPEEVEEPPPAEIVKEDLKPPVERRRKSGKNRPPAPLAETGATEVREVGAVPKSERHKASDAGSHASRSSRGRSGPTSPAIAQPSPRGTLPHARRVQYRTLAWRWPEIRPVYGVGGKKRKIAKPVDAG